MKFAHSALITLAFIAAGTTVVFADSETPAASVASQAAASQDENSQGAVSQSAASQGTPQGAASQGVTAQGVSPVVSAGDKKLPPKQARVADHHPPAKIASAKAVRLRHVHFVHATVQPVYRPDAELQRLAANNVRTCVSFQCPGYVLVGVGF